MVSVTSCSVNERDSYLQKLPTAGLHPLPVNKSDQGGGQNCKKLSIVFCFYFCFIFLFFVFLIYCSLLFPFVLWKNKLLHAMCACHILYITVSIPIFAKIVEPFLYQNHKLWGKHIINHIIFKQNNVSWEIWFQIGK